MSIKQKIESPAGIPAEYHKIVNVQAVVESYYNEEAYKSGKRPVHVDKKHFQNMAQFVVMKEVVPATYDEDGEVLKPAVVAVTEGKKLHDDIVTAAYEKLHADIFTKGEKI